MLLPAYLFSSGLGSKLSTWLTPPQRKIQMTLFAFGEPGALATGASARAMPSRCSMAARASPVKPMPVSARKVRRVIPRQRGEWELVDMAFPLACLSGCSVAQLLERLQFHQVRLILGPAGRPLGGNQPI